MATRTPVKSEVAAPLRVQVVSRYIGHDDVEYASEQEAMLSWEKAALMRYLYDPAEVSGGEAKRVVNLLSSRLNAQGRSKWVDLVTNLKVEVDYRPEG